MENLDGLGGTRSGLPGIFSVGENFSGAGRSSDMGVEFTGMNKNSLSLTKPLKNLI